LERQFRKYFDVARERSGATGDLLLQMLEMRLDNVVFRLAFVDSRRQARQLVNHGHFKVNGRRLDIPSYQVKPGDNVSWMSVGDTVPEFIETLTDGLPKRPVPQWLRLDTENLEGQVITEPNLSEIDTGIESRLIVEFYSR
jgi:small subunit ribosomal protein S4